jgi:adenosine kinase
MKITVIGHIAKDIFHFRRENGEEEIQEHWGGILNSVLALANLIGKDDVVVPVFGVGESDYDEVLTLLSGWNQIETKGIYRLKGASNRVHYFPSARDGIVECSKDLAPPIPFSKIKPHLDTNGVLINMVSGFDLTLETLDFLRMHVREEKIAIHLDVHSLTLGLDQERRRFPRPLTDWRRWCFMINSIQMNEEEARTLSAERFDEETLINHLMSLMVQALVITRGENGATLIVQEHKKFRRFDLPVPRVEKPVSATGYGDVFGAAFFLHAVQTKDYPASVAFANDVAARNASTQGEGGPTARSESFSNTHIQQISTKEIE